MTTQQLYKKLLEFNEDEIFYASYYDAQQNQWKLDEFLSRLDFQQILKRRLIITEVNTGYMPSNMTDETYFEVEDKNSIVISKHNRYTPAFKHKHIFFELVYVLHGLCTQSINHENIDLKEGQFCLLAPNTVHSISVFNSSIIINILIRRNTFEDIFYDILRDTNKISLFFNQYLFSNKQNTYLIFNTNKDLVLKEHVLTMFLEYINKQKYYEKILNSQLMILFNKILQSYENNIYYPPSTKKGDKTFIQIISYIEENYKTISLSELSKYFHFSQPYCSMLIKEYTGKSFTEIVQHIKFQKACSLLINSNISIEEISHLVGFENVEHFNRLFKKIFKMTPGQYRTNSNKNNTA